MTPEELNRTIEFIVVSQARLAAAQEQDRHDRIKKDEERDQIERRLSWVSAEVARLINHQSERMDRLDKFYYESFRQNEDFQNRVLDFQERSLDFQKRSLDFQQRVLDFQEQALVFQQQILDLQVEALQLLREGRQLLYSILDKLNQPPNAS
jgi:hypothetical protein